MSLEKGNFTPPPDGTLTGNFQNQKLGLLIKEPHMGSTYGVVDDFFNTLASVGRGAERGIEIIEEQVDDVLNTVAHLGRMIDEKVDDLPPKGHSWWK